MLTINANKQCKQSMLTINANIQCEPDKKANIFPGIIEHFVYKLVIHILSDILYRPEGNDKLFFAHEY